MTKELRLDSIVNGSKLQVEPAAYLAELACIRQAGRLLPENFWRSPRWRFKFGKEIQAAKHLLKNHKMSHVFKVFVYNKELTTLTDYAKCKFEIGKLEKLEALRKSPKDISGVPPQETRKDYEILRYRDRELSGKIKRGGVFDKLHSMEKDC